MRPILLTFALPLALLGACSAAAHPAPSAAAVAPQVECRISALRTPDGMRFEAHARADAPAFGEYEFVLTKHDRGGSSDIVQGGAYDLRTQASETLGNVELSLERGAHYRAALVLTDADGVACRAERRS